VLLLAFAVYFGLPWLPWGRVEVPDQAVLFDMDGTLVRFNLDYHSARFRVMEELNRLNIYKFRAEENLAIYAMLSKVEAKMPSEEYSRMMDRVQRIIEEYELESAKKTEPMPHALEVLQFVKDKGLKTGIVTNNGRAASNISCSRLNLTSLIDALRWKPDGATVKEALRRLQVRSEDAVFVGDSAIDILAARDSNVVSVALPTGPTKTKDLLTTAPDYAIASLAELPPLIDTLTSTACENS
jgi:HAD superfamily hydrolase (TIGR01509 family)